MREFLTDTIIHQSPARAIEQLAPEVAERRVNAAGHSIAEVVAHLDFWQQWFCFRCEGLDQPMAASAALGWPTVTPGSWPAIEQRYLAGLERIAALGDDHDALDRPLTPPIAFPPLAAYTRRQALTHVAIHNAHHLGQVIVLRQMLGVWPPPAGSWTW